MIFLQSDDGYLTCQSKCVSFEWKRKDAIDTVKRGNFTLDIFKIIKIEGVWGKFFFTRTLRNIGTRL